MKFQGSIYLSSDINLNENNPTSKLISIIKHVGGEIYISGSGGYKYQDLDLFKKNKIKLISSKIETLRHHDIIYNYSLELSIVDLLFNCGLEIF